MNTPQRRVAQFFAGTHFGVDYGAMGEKLDHYCGLIASARYDEACTQFRDDQSLTNAEKREIIEAINKTCLFRRGLEWTNHGILGTFRFWNFQDKAEYLRRANEIANLVMAEITPHVCFGFGSVLGYVRGRDFIPHDDDMDLIIALPTRADIKYSTVKQSLKEVFEREGYRVVGDENLSHLTVARGEFAGTDIFIGFVDPDDSVSWFPSRRGISRFAEVFPAQWVNWFGVDCPMPADPEKYVAAVYGEDWREPIANWNHPWDDTEYRDFL
ncbi:hypothetical protein [Mesorhizobium sp.]|uniref:hypothetical protein n=1 Tax=Mesorhizobium sp. TaxID=1871066 RepID=UPI000FE63B62|nr:hypothetical protein [Mesorhizobium sp.]RWC32696.1 MAG: hypothetical protein EOS27_06285 [Mesorhizobium sp.]TIX28062.1 MAG: LicD family protein [Mesorhizobium sp.]